MFVYPVYPSRRGPHPPGGYGLDPAAYYNSNLAIGDATFYSQYERLPPWPQMSTSGLSPDWRDDDALQHLPSPEGESPRGWDEWEKNANWPLPANYPRPSAKKSNAKPDYQTELERNANWPLPAPGHSRKRTTSQSSARVPVSSSKPTERVEKKANENWPQPASAPKRAARPVIPSQPSQLRTDRSSVSSFLAKDSSSLIRFDIRLPYTCARKLVRGAHWTHLNHGDLRQSACTPPRSRMRIYVPAFPDWVAEARPHARDYVTVEDVLNAVHETFKRSVDLQRLARDSVNPAHADRVDKALEARALKLGNMKMVSFDDTRNGGVLRVDYFGSQCCFAGLTAAYGSDGAEWWIMDVSPEPRR
ncbi:hypothetical protein M0805_005222 [Coniferiporia weirii]|nr:hypothetical protein M0805_005222 [Coniferiporia weirii]